MINIISFYFQLVNKFDELLFTKNDENFVEAFAIFCGMGIHNTHMYEKAITAMAKQSVTLDVSLSLIRNGIKCTFSVYPGEI